MYWIRPRGSFISWMLSSEWMQRLILLLRCSCNVSTVSVGLVITMISDKKSINLSWLSERHKLSTQRNSFGVVFRSPLAVQSLNSSFWARVHRIEPLSLSNNFTTRFSLTPWTGSMLKSETCYLTGSFISWFHWSGLTLRCNNFAIQSSLLNLQLKRLVEKKQNLFELIRISLNLLAMKNIILQWHYRDRGVCNRQLLN